MRPGRGPWARLFATAVVPDESSSVAEHGRRLVESVEQMVVEAGTVAATVDGCEVSIGAEPVPPRIWTALTRSARNSPQILAAIQGRAQSVHLEHLMTLDWERPLVPLKRELSRRCSCERGGACEHVAALAYAFAEEIDRDPSALLRWRGVDVAEEAEPEPEPGVAVETVPPEAWEAGALPELRPLRPLPVAAVLKRLGPSGLRVGGDDLADVLERAYAEFAKSGRTG
jgi:uncharacterized Zn finger protein